MQFTQVSVLLHVLSPCSRHLASWQVLSSSGGCFKQLQFPIIIVPIMSENTLNLLHSAKSGLIGCDMNFFLTLHRIATFIGRADCSAVNEITVLNVSRVTSSEMPRRNECQGRTCWERSCTHLQSTFSKHLLKSCEQVRAGAIMRAHVGTSHSRIAAQMPLSSRHLQKKRLSTKRESTRSKNSCKIFEKENDLIHKI